MPKTMETPRCREQHYNLWMVEPTWFGSAVNQVRSGTMRAREMGDDEDDDRDRPYAIQDGVAVLDLHGPLMKGWSKYGGTSTVFVRHQLRQAVSDDSVKAILLHIDSPGGTVAGTAELAADVRAAKSVKPVYAHVEDLCASAAFWVASQATAIYAIPTSEIGSIGTVMQLADTSGAYEKEGIVVHTLSTGAFKGAGFDGAKVTEEQIDYFQQRVNDLNRHFLNGVRSGRSMVMDDVKKIADGRVFGAAEAKTLGLIDETGSIDDTRKVISKAIKEEDVARAKRLVAAETQGAVLQVEKKSFTALDSRKAAVRSRLGLADDVDVQFALCAMAVEEKRAGLDTARADDPYYVPVRITTDALDRDGEVLIPQGMISTEFDQVGAVFWNHNYDLPVGRADKLTRLQRAVDSGTWFAKRPEGYVGEFFPDYVRALVKQGIVKGISVGFIAVEERRATERDKQLYGNSCRRVVSKWKLVEWSFAPINSNIEATVLDAVERGIVPGAVAAEMFAPQLDVAMAARVLAAVAKPAPGDLPLDAPKVGSTAPLAGITREKPVSGAGTPTPTPATPAPTPAPTPKPPPAPVQPRRVTILVDAPEPPAPKRVTAYQIIDEATERVVARARGRFQS